MQSSSICSAIRVSSIAIIDRGHLWKKAFMFNKWRGSFPRWLYLSWRLICVAKDSWQPCTLKVETLGTPHSLEILISNNFNLGINVRGPKFNLSDSMPGLINLKPIGVGLSIDFLSWLPRILSLLAYVYMKYAYMKFLMIGWLGFRPSIQKVTMDQTIVKFMSLVILIRCWGSLGQVNQELTLI